ncbi:unnamed protein product [Lactuca virosa]|uniref:3'-5' exonuclease domain-containing protein n=1 Tax=Lactuca virosa TaxID=75947 RepID=A0AAU9ML09_9ASTR|nr:unnamed protein product [Lactuca virosa]
MPRLLPRLRNLPPIATDIVREFAGDCLILCLLDNIKTRYPAMGFKGHIVYSRTFPGVEKVADELLKFVELNKKDEGRAIIGFDVEQRPSFKKGVKQGKDAVLQICADDASCHVMHIIHSGFPESLKSLLRDSKFVNVC